MVFLYLEDKSYKEISDTMGISEVNASKNESGKNEIKNHFKHRLWMNWLLKKDWNKGHQNFSKGDLYKMIHKIFIHCKISILHQYWRTHFMA